MVLVGRPLLADSKVVQAVPGPQAQVLRKTCAGSPLSAGAIVEM
jgi:hypothetical protein